MISEKIFLAIGYYFKYTLAIAKLGVFDINWETKEFEYAPMFAQINVGFTRIVSVSLTILLGVFLLLKGSETEANTTNILAFDMVGYAEVATCALIYLMCGWLNNNIREYVYVINQLHVHMRHTIEKLKQSHMARDPSIRKRQRKSEIIFLSLIAVSTLFPFAFSCKFVTVKLEPIHQFIKYIIEEDVTLSARYWPLILGLIFLLIYVVLIMFCAITGGLLYILMAPSTVDFMTPIAITEKTCNMNSKGKVLMQYQFQTKKFGVVSEESIIKFYRTEQVLNGLLNEIYSSLIISVVHVAALVVFVCISFTLITSWDVVCQLPLIAKMVIGMAFCAPLIVEYVEAEMIGDVVTNFRQFTVKSKQLCSVNTYFGKFSKSCRKTMVFEVAYPFFTMSKETFPQFISEGIGFLITLLSIVH